MTASRNALRAIRTSRVLAGSVAGIVAGIGMGIVLQFSTDVLPALGSVTGQPSVVFGWLLHLAIALVFGGAFGVLIELPFLVDVSRSIGAVVLLAIVHASVLATAMLGVVLPLIIPVLGIQQPSALFAIRAIPGPGTGEFLGAIGFGLAHLVYGSFLGVGYAVVRGVSPGDRSGTDRPTG